MGIHIILAFEIAFTYSLFNKLRLNPNVIKGTFTLEPPIGHAVEGYAPRQAKILHAGLSVNMAPSAEHDFFRYFLDGGSNVHVVLSHWRSLFSGRPSEELVHFPGSHGQPLAVVEIAHV